LTLGTGALVYAAPRDLNRLASVFPMDYACALKLGTPVAIKSALYQGAEHGILFRGSSALDSLAQADTFVFDKTGTLHLICNHFRVSTGVNTAVIAGAAFGLLSLVWSVLLHNGMTLGVLVNSIAGVSLKTGRLEVLKDKLETLKVAYRGGEVPLDI